MPNKFLVRILIPSVICIVLFVSLHLYYINLIADLEHQIDNYEILYKTLDDENNTLKIYETELELINSKNMVMSNDVDFHGYYQGNDDYYELINSNTIDTAYKNDFYILQNKAIVTTLEFAAFEAKYLALWEENLDYVLSYFEATLDDEELHMLMNSQSHWELYLKNDDDLVYDMFISSKTLGSQSTVDENNKKLIKTRLRVLELMEYMFIIDRSSIDFIRK